MARWKLDEAHYIDALPPDLDAVEWEYKEQNRVNGREKRIRHKVPLYCEADVVVARTGSEKKDDYIYDGPPTPAMTPLDDEARKISDEYRGNWIHPIESLPGQGYADSVLAALEKQLVAIQSKLTPVAIPAGSVSREEFDELRNQLAGLMAQNAELKAPKGKDNIL